MEVGIGFARRAGRSDGEFLCYRNYGPRRKSSGKLWVTD